MLGVEPLDHNRIVVTTGYLVRACDAWPRLPDARALPPLVGVQVLRGLAYAGYTVSAMTFTAERGDRRTRGKTSGLFNAASSAGQVLGLMLGGTLVEARGFESLFAACALIASCSGALFLSLRARPTPPPEVTTISKEVP